MQYFGADGLGSVRQLYDASGQVIANDRYDPYGNVMSQYGTATSVFGFTGEQGDARANLAPQAVGIEPTLPRNKSASALLDADLSFVNRSHRNAVFVRFNQSSRQSIGRGLSTLPA